MNEIEYDYRDQKLKSHSKVRTVETLQFLRFVAAGLVVLSHISYYIHNRADSGFPIFGALAQGVALFFVISGFIMTVTSNPQVGREGAVSYFTLSRIIRIVPLYWAVNIAKLVGLVVVPGMIAANPTVSNVILSFLFLPAKNADGIVEAFYGVGWSLNFEMAFYALFAFALLIKVRPALIVIPILLLALLIAQFKTEGWSAVAYLLSPTLLNFIWGILIAEWYLTNRTLPSGVSIVLVLIGFLTMFVEAPGFQILIDTKLSYGVIVLGFVALEKQIGKHIPRLFSYLGDSSYSLYLTHPMFGVFAVIAIDRLLPWCPSWLLFVISTIMSFVFASLVHSYFEKPVTQGLRKRFLSKRSKVAASNKTPLNARW